jgi:hypothetical protein
MKIGLVITVAIRGREYRPTLPPVIELCLVMAFLRGLHHFGYNTLTYSGTLEQYGDARRLHPKRDF